MRSVILCEGQDDLWFIGYYLYKSAKWTVLKRGIELEKHWNTYKIPCDEKQIVQYFIDSDNENSVAIFAVGGKDKLDNATHRILKINSDYPDHPISTLVIVRDVDDDGIPNVLDRIGSFFPKSLILNNCEKTEFMQETDGITVQLSVCPIIIPSDKSGCKW